MNPERSSSHGSAPNDSLGVNPKSTPNAYPSDEELLRGFLLDLRASGRKAKTEESYGAAIEQLSKFSRGMGMPPLAAMTAEHVRAR